MSQIPAPEVDASLIDSSPLGTRSPGASRFSGIKVDSLSKTFNPPLFYRKAGQSKSKVVALKDFSLDIVAGEAMGVIGPNGAGKTTLMGCLLGFLHPDSGSVLIDGLPPNSLPIKEIIGYLPERLNFDNWMTAKRFVTHHHELSYQPEESREKDVEDLLNAVGLDPKKWDLPLGNFSRGMLQRVGLAQALVGKPKYLFLDEPASGVDPGGVLAVRQVLKDLKAKGMTIVLNSHQLDQIEKICDRVAFVKGGRLEALEDLVDTDTNRREIAIKFKSNPELMPSKEALQDIALSCQSELSELNYFVAHFTVSNNDSLSQLIKMLVNKDYPVLEVIPQSNRLERYFKEENA
ncbi:MAG: ABC transporter ATP-binding protein [Candidatus Melainabacteria bacterium]|nr:ABC transporter ATP-binding protein [Candidatus Melainabacteria bacterium]